MAQVAVQAPSDGERQGDHIGNSFSVRAAAQPRPARDDSEASVSVVICAYDHRRYDDLVAAVESVLSQTVAPDEVVVAVDRNPALLERVRLEMPSVIAVANVNHAGAGGARNTGVAVCSGDIVAFIDDDARASGSWLEQLLVAFDDPDVVGVGVVSILRGTAADRLGSPRNSTGWSAAPTVDCRSIQRSCGM